MYLLTTLSVFTMSHYYVACSNITETTDYLILGHRAQGGYKGTAKNKKIRINVSALLLKVPNGLKFNADSPESFVDKIKAKSLSFIYKGQSKSTYLNGSIAGDIPKKDIVKYEDTSSNFKEFYTKEEEGKFIAIKSTSNTVSGFSARLVEVERLVTFRPRVNFMSNVRNGGVVFCLSESFTYQIALLLDKQNLPHSTKAMKLKASSDVKVFKHKLFRIDYQSEKEDDLKTKKTFEVLWALGEQFKKEYRDEETKTQTMSKASKSNTLGVFVLLVILVVLGVILIGLLLGMIIVKCRKGKRNRKLSVKYERRRTANTSGSINV
eukprot:GAHX01001040.1.p1 GENE.GAHX01001040.1~~GAHX01001040.1.p1  ORF type:complete len:322 (-),score=58.07 GAHX01001040.1:32-997(-)